MPGNKCQYFNCLKTTIQFPNLSMFRFPKDEGQSLKRWVVVIFTESNDYSVIPVNWLVQSIDLKELSNKLINVDSVQFCQWPPFKVTNIELLNAVDPDESWKQFKIKIVDNKIYVTEILTNMQVEQLNIKKELIASNLILTRLLYKVEVLECNSKNNCLNSVMVNQYIDTNFLSLFPINNKEGFQLIENNILNELVFVTKLKSFIKSIGGCGFKNNITRVLQKLFTNEFAIITTWTGHGKNISISIGTSEVMKLLRRIIKANSNNTLTDSEFEIVVQEVCKSKKLSSVSAKHFKKVLKAEQHKCIISNQNNQLNNIKSIVSSSVIINVNDVTPQFTESVVNVMNSEYSFDMLNIEPLKTNNNNFSNNPSSVHTIYHTVLSSPLKISVSNLSISEKLRLLILKHKVSHNFCNSLLGLLKGEGLDVPKNIRTLMKTPKNHEIVENSGGSYIHLGLRNMLIPYLIKQNVQLYIPSRILNIGINIDGLPIAKSSKSQLWPILISILNFKELPKNVIPIGIFHGFQKPKSIEEYLNTFIIDLLEVIDNGLNVNETLFTLTISNISCDAPAKTFLLNVKSHNAYFDCTSCTEEGRYISRA
ncbi:hypothetical protein AGLY_011547 [Aphis glycines]|uniref:DUF4806 domain-containing protein n=1 Tax=Aphis glycines TaxID=307491 RepID=A0A6G0TBT7_APHGL|nr:hypothetical protein AGLY_011547 [Aphis glycines]